MDLQISYLCYSSIDHCLCYSIVRALSIGDARFDGNCNDVCNVFTEGAGLSFYLLYIVCWDMDLQISYLCYSSFGIIGHCVLPNSPSN